MSIFSRARPTRISSTQSVPKSSEPGKTALASKMHGFINKYFTDSEAI